MYSYHKLPLIELKLQRNRKILSGLLAIFQSLSMMKNHTIKPAHMLNARGDFIKLGKAWSVDHV